MKTAFILDDLVEYPPKNGVTRRFFSMAKSFYNEPNFLFYIGVRGYTNISSLSEFPNITLFPSQWLYDVEGFSNITALLQSENIAIIHTCNAHTIAPLVGFRLAAALDAYCVVDFHDINGILSSMIGLDESRVRSEMKLQVHVAECADHCCFISDRDIQTFHTQFEYLHINASHIPAISEDTGFTSRLPDAKDLLFIGNLDYPPNLNAAMYIIDELAPQVHDTGTSIHIVGPGGPAVLPTIIPNNVILHGAVDQLSSIAHHCGIGLAPLKMGSGMKVKLLDYAQLDLAIVSTDLGVEGYGKADGVEVATMENFAKTVLALLESPSRRLMNSRRFREFCSVQFSSDKILSRLKAVYDGLSQRRPSAKPRIIVHKDYSHSMDGIFFPPPMHFLEPRYREAQRFQYDTALQVRQHMVTVEIE